MSTGPSRPIADTLTTMLGALGTIESHPLNLMVFEKNPNRAYIPGYFPKKINTKSMESVIPCATIGTAKFRPVRR
jgi:hypothetical protein